jgi:uncharacterized protein
MSLKINNLRLPVEAPESEVPPHVAHRLGIAPGEIRAWRILRKSLDARSRHDLRFVYSAVVDLYDESGAAAARFERDPDVGAYMPATFDDPHPGAAALEERPVIVGSGPAGLLAACFLAQRGYRPLMLERGFPVKERVSAIRVFDAGRRHLEENNYLFGEGGAGCFSDGKLTCRMSGPDVDWVLRAFIEGGARESIAWEHRPHLGSNRLPLICRNLRRKIESWGGEYRFGCRMEGLDVQDGAVRGVLTSSGRIATRQVILAIGHSARDTYRMLFNSGVPMRPKAFQLGLRIEQPQESVNRWKYGKPGYLELLGAADYTLVAKGKRDVYSFCMCAGGTVIPSVSESGMFCTNGMSNSRHDTPFANSGIMVTLEPEEFGADHPLAGVELQRHYERLAFELGGSNYLAPIQSARDFVDQRPVELTRVFASSYQRGVRTAEVSGLLPETAIRAIRDGLPIMDHKWRGEFLKDATLVGPEMRGSSPVRIERDRHSRQTPGMKGLFPVGEGAGYAGGIVSAAVDGMRSAREIVRRFAPLDVVR